MRRLQSNRPGEISCFRVSRCQNAVYPRIPASRGLIGELSQLDGAGAVTEGASRSRGQHPGQAGFGLNITGLNLQCFFVLTDCFSVLSGLAHGLGQFVVIIGRGCIEESSFFQMRNGVGGQTLIQQTLPNTYWPMASLVGAPH